MHIRALILQGTTGRDGREEGGVYMATSRNSEKRDHKFEWACGITMDGKLQELENEA